MDLSKAKPSPNFKDNTSRTGTQEFLDNLLLKLNPVIAIRKIRSDLIDKGVIEIPGSEALAQSGRAGAARLREQAQRDKAPAGGLSLEELEAIVRRMESSKEKTMK